MTREESLKLYYKNPNHCLQCGKVIEVADNQRLSDVKRKKFCSHSCAASFNNKERVKHTEDKICPRCGGPKHKDSEVCKNCWKELNGIENKTLGYFVKGHKYLSSKCQEIRAHARKVLENSDREKVCQYCRNHEFDEILEVHHLKSILKFDESTLISEINNKDNLVWLCPNHHTMLEKGLISLDKPRVSSVVE